MHNYQGENIISIERKYIDVPLATITSPAFQNAALGTRPSQPVHELGLRLLDLAKKGDAEGVRELMNRGAPFSTDWLGTSPLHFAAQFNHLETVEILLKAGISRDARNKVERTPLHVAAQEGHAEVVKLLISYGADVDCRDMLKMTPLHWASENGQVDCVRFLIDFGADPLVLNKFDKTPQNIAHDNNFLIIEEMLQEAATIDPITRKMLRSQGLENVINNLKEDDRLAATATNISNNSTTLNSNSSALNNSDTIIESSSGVDGTMEELHTAANGAVYKIHKIVGRRRLNTIKPIQQHQLKSDVNIGFSRVTANDQVETSVNNFATNDQQNDSDSENTNSTLKMLQEHGITMLPVDDTSIVESAVQSGQTVVLTEAGKMALNLTKLNQNVPSNDIKKLPVTTKFIKCSNQKVLLGGRKLIRVQPEELINMTKDRKVIIHTGDKRLGRPGQIVFSKRSINNLGKPPDVQNKLVTSSDLNRVNSDVVPVDEVQESIPNDVDELRKLLVEARREAKMYKERLLLTEKEFREYKLKHESAINSK